MKYSIIIAMMFINCINSFPLPLEYIHNCKNFKNYKGQRSPIVLNCLNEKDDVVDANVVYANVVDANVVDANVVDDVVDANIVHANVVHANDVANANPNVVDVNSVVEYFNDPRIHNMGNVGFGGWVHAQLAPYATKMIDNIRYDGNDIRALVIDRYNLYYKNKYNKCPKIIDLCCGIGISTMANQTGIDTSYQMIDKAKSIKDSKNYHLRKGKKLFTKFKTGNAENYGKNKQFDCSTIMFALHEMPQSAHKKIIQNCFRISRDNVLFVDISPDYNPSQIMIAGEPYLLDYLANFDNLMKTFGFSYIELVPGHVRVWFYNF